MTSSGTNSNGAKKNGNASGVDALDGFPVPKLDLEAALANQRKNIETLVRINELALSGVREIQRRQTEYLWQAVDGFTSVLLQFAQPASVSRDWIQKQAESSKQVIDKGLAETRELAKLMAKTNSQMFGLLGQRMSDGLGEAVAHD